MRVLIYHGEKKNELLLSGTPLHHKEPVASVSSSFPVSKAVAYIKRRYGLDQLVTLLDIPNLPQHATPA